MISWLRSILTIAMLTASLPVIAHPSAEASSDDIAELLKALDSIQHKPLGSTAQNCSFDDSIRRPIEMTAAAEEVVPLAPPAASKLPNLPAGLFANGGDNCSAYIDGDGGAYGSKGQKIVNAFNQDEAYYEPLLGDSAAQTSSMKRMCPGFAKMNKDERKHFWVWALASIAWQETKCGLRQYTKPHVDVTGKRVTGEFQMEQTLRHRSWRGNNPGAPWRSKRYCAVASVDDFDNNLMCSMDILIGQFKGEYGRPPGLVGPSYFAELRTLDRPSRWDRSPIIKRIKAHPGCADPGAPAATQLARDKKQNPSVSGHTQNRKPGKKKRKHP